MKKFMKKVMSAIAAAAMAFTMVVVPSVKAEAAEGADNGAYYVIGTMNNWSTTAPSAMTKNGSVYTYEYDLAAAGTVEFKIIEQAGADWDNVGYQINNNGNNFSKTAGQAGTVKITFDTSLLDTSSWWNGSSAVTITGTAFETEAVAADIYYVKGACTGTTLDWDLASSNGLMTESGNTHSLTLTGLTAGTELKFKVLHDPALNQWSESYIPADATTDSDGNAVYTIEADGDVTITIDCTTSVVSVTLPENTGDAGNSGNAGDTGNSGNAGDTGNSGNAGDAGNSGDAGDAGNSGDAGDAGNSGNAGDAGSSGDAGTGTGTGTGNVPAGVSIPIIGITFVAIAAFAGAVICAKKKVTE